eukprot:Clim_evm17s77 gene=Clim_evmTU17s77
MAEAEDSPSGFYNRRASYNANIGGPWHQTRSHSYNSPAPGRVRLGQSLPEGPKLATMQKALVQVAIQVLALLACLLAYMNFLLIQPYMSIIVAATLLGVSLRQPFNRLVHRIHVTLSLIEPLSESRNKESGGHDLSMPPGDEVTERLNTPRLVVDESGMEGTDEADPLHSTIAPLDKRKARRPRAATTHASDRRAQSIGSGRLGIESAVEYTNGEDEESFKPFLARANSVKSAEDLLGSSPSNKDWGEQHQNARRLPARGLSVDPNSGFGRRHSLPGDDVNHLRDDLAGSSDYDLDGDFLMQSHGSSVYDDPLLQVELRRRRIEQLKKAELRGVWKVVYEFFGIIHESFIESARDIIRLLMRVLFIALEILGRVLNFETLQVTRTPKKPEEEKSTIGDVDAGRKKGVRESDVLRGSPLVRVASQTLRSFRSIQSLMPDEVSEHPGPNTRYNGLSEGAGVSAFRSEPTSAGIDDEDPGPVTAGAVSDVYFRYLFQLCAVYIVYSTVKHFYITPGATNKSLRITMAMTWMSFLAYLVYFCVTAGHNIVRQDAGILRYAKRLDRATGNVTTRLLRIPYNIYRLIMDYVMGILESCRIAILANVRFIMTLTLVLAMGFGGIGITGYLVFRCMNEVQEVLLVLRGQVSYLVSGSENYDFFLRLWDYLRTEVNERGSTFLQNDRIAPLLVLLGFASDTSMGGSEPLLRHMSTTMPHVTMLLRDFGFVAENITSTFANISDSDPAAGGEHGFTRHTDPSIGLGESFSLAMNEMRDAFLTALNDAVGEFGISVEHVLESGQLKDVSAESLQNAWRMLQLAITFPIQLLYSVMYNGFGLVIFLSIVFFILNGDHDLPNIVIRPFPVGEHFHRRFSKAVTEAIQGIYVCTLKISVFHMLLTWVTFSFLEVKGVYLSMLLAGFFSVLPFLSSYMICISPLVQGYFKGNMTGATIVFFIHFLAVWTVDGYIYEEIPSSHPFLAGLAIVLGIYTFDIPGALYGPLLVCLAIIVYQMVEDIYLIGTPHALGAPSWTSLETPGRQTSSSCVENLTGATASMMPPPPAMQGGQRSAAAGGSGKWQGVGPATGHRMTPLSERKI